MTGVEDFGRPVKRSISVAGHRTSLSMEPRYWLALKNLARREGLSIAKVVAKVDSRRGPVNLSSAVRQFLLDGQA